MRRFKLKDFTPMLGLLNVPFILDPRGWIMVVFVIWQVAWFTVCVSLLVDLLYFVIKSLG